MIPLEVLFDALLARCRSCISASDTVRSESRDSPALFLHHFAILCKESRRIASEDASFAAILYYERVRLQMLHVPTRPGVVETTKIGFFWEGLPRQLSLALPSEAEILHPVKARDLTSIGIIAEQQRFIQKVEAAPDQRDWFWKHFKIDVDSSDGLSARTWHPSQLHSVPVKVRAFVTMMTSLFHSLRLAKRPSEFSQCWNKRCCRLFYSLPKYKIRAYFDPMNNPVEILDLPLCVPEVACDIQCDSLEYWKTCKLLPFYEEPSRRFCTSACCIEWKRSLDSFIPSSITFEPDFDLPTGRLSRIHFALERVFDRNSRFKIMYEARMNTKKSRCVSKKLLRNEIESRIEMFNIDTAVLYWASIVSRLPFYAADESLPGFEKDWRTMKINIDRSFYISKIYAQAQGSLDTRKHKVPYIITNIHSGGRLFSAVKSQCMFLDKKIKSVGVHV